VIVGSTGWGSEIVICRLRDGADRSKVAAQLDAIFFEASPTKAFANSAARAAFRERWLGRYVVHYPNEVFLACEADGHVVGYLVGCLEDPARATLFEDLSYVEDFGPITQEFPAHLHINVKAAFRSRGIGRMLIEAFAAHAAAAGAPGMHIVTGELAGNVTFYRRCGFEPLASTEWDGKRLVLLGRRFASSWRPPS
jgi:GNAT superfamily N-acetyltransferase